MDESTEEAIEREIDALYNVLSLPEHHPAVSAYVFERLVDLLAAQLFADLRRRFAEGELSRRDYIVALETTMAQCRVAGLVPQAPAHR